MRQEVLQRKVKSCQLLAVPIVGSTKAWHVHCISNPHKGDMDSHGSYCQTSGKTRLVGAAVQHFCTLPLPCSLKLHYDFRPHKGDHLFLLNIPAGKSGTLLPSLERLVIHVNINATFRILDLQFRLKGVYIRHLTSRIWLSSQMYSRSNLIGSGHQGYVFLLAPYSEQSFSHHDADEFEI